MGLEDVRARLKDRQVKDGALGTIDTTVCLDLALLDELDRLQEELAAAQPADTAAPAGKARLSGPAAKSTPEPEATELEARLTAKEQEVREASLRLVFRSISSSRYQELLNNHPDVDATSEARTEFYNDLASACLAEVWQDKERIVGLEWDEIREQLSFGEWDEATTKVYSLNRRKVDLPFSLRP